MHETAIFLLPVIQMQNVKILWDMNIQMDHVTEHRRPDIVVIDKDKTVLLTDIAVPADARVEGARKDG